jgi:hypothetical protein
MQRAARSLNDIAVHLMLYTGGIDCHAGIVTHDDAFDMDLTGATVYLDIGYPRCPRCPKPRPLAVDITGIGNTLTA